MSRRDSWIKARGARTLKPTSLSTFFGSKARGDNYGIWVDHVEVFKTPDGRVFTSQPYARAWTPKDEAALAELCKHFGYEYRTSTGESWYYPGESILVEVWKPRTERTRQ